MDVGGHETDQAHAATTTTAATWEQSWSSLALENLQASAISAVPAVVRPAGSAFRATCTYLSRAAVISCGATVGSLPSSAAICGDDRTGPHDVRRLENRHTSGATTATATTTTGSAMLTALAAASAHIDRHHAVEFEEVCGNDVECASASTTGTTGCFRGTTRRPGTAAEQLRRRSLHCAAPVPTPG